MRQLWISAGILAAMLLLLSWNGSHLAALSEPICQEIILASEAAKKGDWEEAARHTATVQAQWQGEIEYLRLVQYHADLEEISALLEESKAFLTCQELGAYLAKNERLLGEMEGLSELEHLSAGNLF